MIVREKEDASFAWGKESADCVQCGIDCGDAVDSHIVLGTLTEQISTTKRGMLEYKDSKGQDCYFYYSNIAGTDLDMPFYVCNAECVSGMKKRESKSETFSANPFEYEFLYAPLGDKGAYAYQQPWYGFSVNKDSEEKEIAVEFLRFMMQEKEIDEMASIKGLPSVAENGTDERYAGLRDAKNIEASFINDGSVPDSIRAALEQACTAMQTRQCRCLWSCVQRNKIGKREERLICENKWVAFWCQRW